MIMRVYVCRACRVSIWKFWCCVCVQQGHAFTFLRPFTERAEGVLSLPASVRLSVRKLCLVCMMTSLLYTDLGWPWGVTCPKHPLAKTCGLLLMVFIVNRSRPKLNYGAGRDFGVGPKLEPRGNNRSFPETRERACAPVKKIGSRDQVKDKTKFWAGTYYWTGTKFWAAGSKFWSAKSRVRLAGVTENAGRTCRKMSGIKRFFASRE